jgi:hypothetical protein
MRVNFFRNIEVEVGDILEQFRNLPKIRAVVID